MSTRTSALDTLVYGVDVQSGDVRGDSPSYALVMFDGETTERDVVSRRKLLRLIDANHPDIVATDNMYELASDKKSLIKLLQYLPDETRLVQVTGAERPEPLSRVASRHGVPYGKDPMQEAEAAAMLAARNVGHEVTAFTDTSQVKVSRGRATGKGGWSEDRFTRRIHGSVRTRTREVKAAFDDAGLEYELDVTEKYGGYANAVFTVQAPPSAIPVSSERSGDVRIDIDRERRDGIEFRELAKRRDPVIVGLDPGTTTAAAILDLDGHPLDTMSSRTVDTAAVIEWIIERGRPVMVAADVTPMPTAVEKLRRSFEAVGWEPDRDLLIDEKLHRTREYGYENDHERDALAAGLFAFDRFETQIDRITRKVPPHIEIGDVIRRVLGEELSVEAAISALEPADEEPAAETNREESERSPEQKRISVLERRVQRLENHISELQSTIDEKNEQLAEYEDELSDARRAERRDAHARRSVTRLQRENKRLTRELEEQRSAALELDEKLERLKALWRLDHSNFSDIAEKKRGLVPLKPVEQFTIDAIEAADEAYGLAKDDVVLLRDASGAGERTANRLVDVQPRVVLLQRGGLSEVADEILFENEIPVGSADDVAMQEVDDLAVARERDIEGVIAEWEEYASERKRNRNAAMVDRVISEHRSSRDE